MMTIYLIPAGKTDLSQKGELLGINNPSLSAAGKTYADEISSMLSCIVLEAVFSGPLKRESETAERIAKVHSLPVRERRDLIDINYGSWSGRTWDMIEATEAQAYNKLRQSPQKFKFPSGEPIKKCGKRVQNFASQLLANYGTGNIAVIADDFIIFLFASQISKTKLSVIEPWKPSQGKISIAECNEGRCIIKQLRGR